MSWPHANHIRVISRHAYCYGLHYQNGARTQWGLVMWPITNWPIIECGKLYQWMLALWMRVYFDLNVKPQTQFWEGISKMYVESMYVVCRNHFKHIWSPKRVPKWVLCLLQIEFQPVNSTLTQINHLFLILFKHLFLIILIVCELNS